MSQQNHSASRAAISEALGDKISGFSAEPHLTLQALTHSSDPPVLTETPRTRLQMAEAQSCVNLKSQKLTEIQNRFKTETA